MSISNRNVLTAYHGLTGRIPKPAAKATVLQYIRDITESDGHRLHVSYGQSDHRQMDERGSEESIIFLPPKYLKRSLHLEYNSFQQDLSLCVHSKTFCSIMDKELTFIRVSLRKRGLCDVCYTYKCAVRSIADDRLTEKAEEWRKHLELA